jgi:hypothetical protein
MAAYHPLHQRNKHNINCEDVDALARTSDIIKKYMEKKWMMGRKQEF